MDLQGERNLTKEIGPNTIQIKNTIPLSPRKLVKNLIKKC